MHIVRLRRSLLALGLSAFLALPLLAQQRLTPADAKAHIGEQATVCGTVASATYAARSKGQPTFLNLDKPYPNQAFTVVIWGSDRAKFGQPETKFKNKRICVTGKIQEYRGGAEIVARDEKQIVIEQN